MLTMYYRIGAIIIANVKGKVNKIKPFFRTEQLSRTIKFVVHTVAKKITRISKFWPEPKHI